MKKYLANLLRFYFVPVWQSLFSILYLAFFSYFTVFYLGNLWLALKFIFYTLGNSTRLLGLAYLFWGVIFLITLIIPFSVSLYSIFLLYEVWRKGWQKRQKLLVTILIILTAVLVIVVMDEVIREVVQKQVLQDFVARNELSVSGR